MSLSYPDFAVLFAIIAFPIRRGWTSRRSCSNMEGSRSRPTSILGRYVLISALVLKVFYLLSCMGFNFALLFLFLGYWVLKVSPSFRFQLGLPQLAVIQAHVQPVIL